MGSRHIPIQALHETHPVESAVRAMLSEVNALLDALISDGQPGAIDLHSLPLAPDVKAVLEARLGQGEVYVEVELRGLSRAFETDYAGVWRVTHFDDEARVIADAIEVNWVPDIVRAHREDVAGARDRLRLALVSPAESNSMKSNPAE